MFFAHKLDSVSRLGGRSMDLIIVLLSLLAATGSCLCRLDPWRRCRSANFGLCRTYFTEGNQKGGTRGIEGFANAGKSALGSVNTDRPVCLSNHLQYLCEVVLLGSPPRELME